MAEAEELERKLREAGQFLMGMADAARAQGATAAAVRIETFVRVDLGLDLTEDDDG